MTDLNVESRGPIAERRLRGAVFFLALSNFLVTFDITAVVVAMPTIRSELELSISGFAWVMDAYSLAFVVLLTAAGSIADKFGARFSLIFGILIFLVGSILCAAAPTSVILWVGRAVQGFGSAFVICGALALLSRLFVDRNRRIQAFAFAGAVAGAAMALGPSIGGILTETFGWRSIFWINIFVVAAIVIGVLMTVERDTPSSQVATRIDYAGVSSLTVFLASTIFALLHGTELWGYDLPLWLVVASLLGLLALFIATQVLQASPAFRLDVFRSREFVGMCFVPLGLSIGFWSLLVYLPLLLSDAFGLSTSLASGLMLALTLPMVFLPFLGSKLAQKSAERTFFGLGLAVLALGCALMGFGANLANLPLVLAGMAVAGAATAIVNAQISGAIVAFVPAERSGAASAIATTLRQGGFAIGIALLGATLTASDAGEYITNSPSQFQVLFYLASACSALAALILVILVRPKSTDASAP